MGQEPGPQLVRGLLGQVAAPFALFVVSAQAHVGKLAHAHVVRVLAHPGRGERRLVEVADGPY